MYPSGDEFLKRFPQYGNPKISKSFSFRLDWPNRVVDRN
jgi:hypothetical protein